jgi:hypothetical protein
LLHRPRTATTRVPNGCTTVDSNLQLVLAGRVAAWRPIKGAGNLELDADVWTAVAGRLVHIAPTAFTQLRPRSGRAAGDVADRRRGRPDRLRRGTRRPHPASAGSLEDRQGAGQRLFGFDRAFGLAVHDGLVAALGRETPIGPALSRGEVRSSAGQLLASLRAIGEPQDVALGGAAVVALTAVQGGALLSVFDAKTGKLRREVAVQAWSRLAERDASGRWVVFHARRRITASTCRAEGSCGSRRRGTPPIGLTVSGRRAAWAEPGGSTSRIRAATLPG